MSEKQIFTLFQVVKSIKKTLEDRYTQTYWVKAEMHKLNRYPSGHAFPELVQKEEEKILAQISSNLIEFSRTTQHHFEKTTSIADNHVNNAVGKLGSSIEELQEKLQ
jgi:hypothetical protein